MKISKKIIVATVLVGLVSVIYLLPSGFFNPFMDGNEGVSKSIYESKLRGVFVAEYYSPQEVQVINDSIKVHVKEAWLEQSWYYKLFALARPHKEWYQLCMVVSDSDIHGYARGWTIGRSTGRASDRLFASYDISVSEPVTPYLACVARSFGDREVFDVVQSLSAETYNPMAAKIYDSTKKIGEFVLLRKKME